MISFISTQFGHPLYTLGKNAFKTKETSTPSGTMYFNFDRTGKTIKISLHTNIITLAPSSEHYAAIAERIPAKKTVASDEKNVNQLVA